MSIACPKVPKPTVALNIAQNAFPVLRHLKERFDNLLRSSLRQSGITIQLGLMVSMKFLVRTMFHFSDF